MSINRKSVLSKRIWIAAICSLFLLALLYNCADGFKLKDLTAHEQEAGNKSPRKFRSADGKSTPFRKIEKIVNIEDDVEDEESDIGEEHAADDAESEFKFEKVRKADKAELVKPEPIFKTIEKEEEKIEDAIVEEAEEKLSFSVLSMLNMFGVGENSEGQESNSIINWLKSFKRQEEPVVVAKTKPKEPDESIYDSIMRYLDRWPFNLIIQFDEIKSTERDSEPETNATHHKSSQVPITQQQFDYLLNRLPSFVINPAIIPEVECQKQLQIFNRQFRGQKLWTLQMFDSTGKISSSILRGNINQFGDFDQCTQIKTVVKVSAEDSVRIKGKYCLAHVDLDVVDSGLKLPIYMALGRGLLRSRYQNPSHFVPRYTTINWGVCLPNACSAISVKRMLEADLKAFNSSGVHFRVDVNEKDCFVRRSQRLSNLVTTNWKFGMTLVFYSSFLLLAFVGTITEFWSPVRRFISRNTKDLLKASKPNLAKEPSLDEQINEEDKEDPKNDYSIKRLCREVILSFSLRRTIISLVTPIRRDEIVAVNGLKVLATFAIILFLKFMMLGHLPITNRDKLVKMMSLPFSIVFRTPLMYLDAFLFLSATTATYRLCQEHEQKSSISVVRRFVGRLVRSLPTLFAVLYFQTWILPHVGAGPLWSNLVSHNTKLCEQNMWRNFFTVQNAMNLEETCSPFTIQLAVDQQLYLLAPLIVWLYYSYPDIGLLIYSAIHVISVAVRFARTNSDRLSPIVFHGMNVSQFYRTANYVYSSPLQRATAYISGVGMGILLSSIKGSCKLSKVVLLTGWATSLWCLGWCFWFPSHSTSIDFIYDPTVMAPYASWAPLLLTFSLAWITLVSFTNNVPAIFNTLMSSTVVHFLSKIAYPMQMVSYVVLIYAVGITKESSRFSFADMFNISELTVIITASTIIAIIFDVPMQNIRKILIEFELPPGKPAIEAITDIPLDHRLPWKEESKEKLSMEESEDSKSNYPEENDENVENGKEDNEALEKGENFDAEESPSRVKLNIFENQNGTTEFKWKRFKDVPEESWRTESDLDAQDSNSDTPQMDDSDEVNDDGEEDEEQDEEDEGDDDEEEEDEEISESDEIIRRPPSAEQNFRYRPGSRWNYNEINEE